LAENDIFIRDITNNIQKMALHRNLKMTAKGAKTEE
jgi:hypothetical protein